MNKSDGKFRITACTLIIPLYGKSVGRFCNWYKTDQTNTFSGTPSFINSKFHGNELMRRGTTYLLNTDRSKFDYADYPAGLLKINQDFVRFGIAEDDPCNIWEGFFANCSLFAIR